MTQPQLPQTERERLETATRHLLVDLGGLVSLLRETEDTQWTKSKAPIEVDDTKRRAQGGHSDPTADTATDGKRLSVRHQRKRSIKELTSISAKLHGLLGDLQRAVDKHTGNFPD